MSRTGEEGRRRARRVQHEHEQVVREEGELQESQLSPQTLFSNLKKQLRPAVLVRERGAPVSEQPQQVGGEDGREGADALPVKRELRDRRLSATFPELSDSRALYLARKSDPRSFSLRVERNDLVWNRASLGA